MSPSRWIASVLLGIVTVLTPLVAPLDVSAQKGKQPLKPGAEGLLKPGPRPARPDLAPSTLPLKFIDRERIAFVGNSTAERMNLFGHFETLLQLRHAKQELVIRNFARPADEVSIRQRGGDYVKLDDPLYAFNPDTFLCFFGWNESFAGPSGVEKFKADYENFLNDFENRYPRDDTKAKPRFVIVSPLAFEPTGDKLLPSGQTENTNLKLYAEAAKAVADKRKIAFIDLYTPTLAAFGKEPGMQFTINGVHVSEAGDKLVAGLLDVGLFGGKTSVPSESVYEKLREAIVDKSWNHSQDYRMVNGWYVYGGRRTFDTETFPREYVKLRAMVAVRDRYVHDIAQGKQVAAKPDDSNTGELYTPPTRFGSPGQKYSEASELRYLTPEDFIKSCTVPPGFEVKLFADEKKFPEIAKPVQLSFDNKGRLWVATMPSYPQWRPGDPKPADKLVILVDTDGDGVADKSTVFYDKLHCPTGFAFVNGGVMVVDQPHILFLKDTNGDDKADVVEVVVDGWASEDTHHTIGAFEADHGGRLHMLEGVAMSTAVETPWGAFRNYGSSGSYVMDPKTFKVSHFVTPGYGNPWCYVYNEWGQGICGDGTGASQHWDTPLSGKQYGGRRGLNPVFNTEGMRPVVGSEFLVSRQFPDNVQGQFTYACVINTNGMPRWTITDDGGGFKGERVRHNPKDNKTAFDLLKSTDKHFRPVDPQIGPDGALWFGDWASALIGHMQYSQRDPNRISPLGRIYRLVYKDKPLLKPVTQFGKSNAEILEQFREYEWRTRARARDELHSRPTAEVLPAVVAWVSKLDAKDPMYDRLRCEALWIQEGHHAVDVKLLGEVLGAKTGDARAAAVRIAADEREYLGDVSAMLIKAATDENPRVRTEACRGLSYLPTPEASVAVVAAYSMGNDYWVRYTAEAALAANEPAWRAAFLKGEIAKEGDAKSMLQNIISSSKTGGLAVPYLQQLLGRDPQNAETRNKAMTALSVLPGGNVNNGRAVFQRNCLACHKIGSEGQDYGPAMEKVGTRLNRYKLVESIIDPNAEVDKKYLSTKLQLLDGKAVTGLLVSETKEVVVIFDGKEKRTVKVGDIEERTTLKQSSMPEGLAGTIAPVEFLDLIAYLSSLK